IVIVRETGLTQQDPNSNFSNAGIQPFNWYHMWAGTFGIGGFNGSVAQYGQTLAMLSDDNVYLLSMSGGLQPIGAKINKRVYTDRTQVQGSPGVYIAGPITHQTILSNAWWYFSSIINVNGQLHYMLAFSSYVTNGSALPTSQITQCFAYDYNFSEDAW